MRSALWCFQSRHDKTCLELLEKRRTLLCPIHRNPSNQDILSRRFWDSVFSLWTIVVGMFLFTFSKAMKGEARLKKDGLEIENHQSTSTGTDNLIEFNGAHNMPRNSNINWTFGGSQSWNGFWGVSFKTTQGGGARHQDGTREALDLSNAVAPWLPFIAFASVLCASEVCREGQHLIRLF